MQKTSILQFFNSSIFQFFNSSPVAFDEVIGGVETQFASLAEVADGSRLVVEEDVAEAAVVPGFGEVRLYAEGTVVVADGLTVVAPLSVECGAVIVEQRVLRVDGEGTVQVGERQRRLEAGIAAQRRLVTG